MNQNYSSLFKRDPNYNGAHVVQTYLKKEKSSSSYKIFGDYNTRFFTLNMQTFQFYYTPKDQYSQKDIKYINFNDLKSVVDNGCQKNSKGDYKEWTFKITLYFNSKYTILYCRNENMKQLWLKAFKNIIRISDNTPLLYNDVKDPKSDEKVSQNINLNTQRNDDDFQKISNSKESTSDSLNISQNIFGDSKAQNRQISSQKNDDYQFCQSKNSIDSDKHIQQKNSNTNITSKEDLDQNERNEKIMVKQQFENLPQQNKKNVDNFEVENLEQTNLQILSNNNTLQTGGIIMNEHQKSSKKSQRQSLIKNNFSGKKHIINIFDEDEFDESSKIPDLQIEFQSKKSQNGWDKNDLNILQDILRQNSAQLNISKEEESSQLPVNNESLYQEKQQQQQKQQSSQQQNDQKQETLKYLQNQDFINYNENQNPQLKNKNISLDKCQNNYGDWDCEKDNVTPHTKQSNINKQQKQIQNKWQQQFQNSNNQQQKSNQNYLEYKENIPIQNQCHLLNNYISQNKIDNDYDNWDDEM